jgi:hypothetical protein
LQDFRGSAAKTRDGGFYYSEAEGLFNKRTTRRGMWSLQPSDHISTAEISPESERGLTSGPRASAALGRGWLTSRAQLQGRGRGIDESAGSNEA